MKAQIKTAVALAMTILLCFGVAARADDSAKAPSTGSVNPDLGKGPKMQESVQSPAPPATRTTTTGAHDQSSTVKSMNNEGKDRTSTEGK